MDAVPYDFIDRVFTKLDVSEHEKLTLKSPLWMEARRIYENKLQDLIVELYADVSNPPLTYRLTLLVHNSNVDMIGCTIDDLLRMDDRFIRIADLRIETYTFAYEKGLPIDENLPKLIQFISRFTVKQLTVLESHPEFIDECLKNGLKATKLDLQAGLTGFTINSASLLKNQLARTGELKWLILGGDNWPSDIIDDVMEFVFGSKFECLECDINVLDMDALQKIVAYWRSMEVPWKSAHISVSGKDLRDKFNLDFLSLTRTDNGKLREERGEHSLEVYRYETTYTFSFRSTSKLYDNY